MAKASTNPITSLNQDWGHDTDTNLPFSGEAVQNFIKSYLRSVTGAAWFNPSNYTMYFFASAEDRDAFISDPTQTTLVVFSCPMNFSSTMYRVDITNNTGSTVINTATNAESCQLSASFVVQTKSITDQSWTDTQTGCYVTIGIDRGLSGNYVTIADRTLYASGATINIDVLSQLAIGSNRVRYYFEAEDGTVTGTLVYTINFAELYVELFSNTWYRPILQSDDDSWYLGGFRIAGAGYKTLHISLYNSSGTKVVDDLTAAIGTTNAYVSTPYYYRFVTGSPILSLNTGVYTARVYVSTEQLSSEVVEYQVMYIKTADASSAQLVCINSVPDKIYNYSTSVICEYAIYNGNASSGNPVVRFARMNGSTEVDHEDKTLDNIPTMTAQSLEYSAEWGVEGEGYSIAFTITFGTASASASVPLDNSTVFPPTAGYDFYMNPSSRNNSETDSARRKIVNEANGARLSANWSDVDCIDGIDGWTTDENGRKCLRIAAGTYVSLPVSSFQMLPGDGITFEICYKVSNVSNYDENVITVAENATTASFKGIRIRPTNITIHSANDTSAEVDPQRGTNICDEVVIHFVLIINPSFEGNNKIVKGFVNGCKNFEFPYSSSTDWPTNAPLKIGCDKSDVEVYFIRRYSSALSDTQVQSNYINSLTSVAERTAMSERQMSVLDMGGTNVDYEMVKNSGFNFFVVQMEDNGGVPSAANGWGKDTKKKSTLEMHYGQHPEWDWKIQEVETTGQGTTSMNYYRWNIRWRIDKSNDSKRVPVSYLLSRTKAGNSYQYTWGPSSTIKTVRFDGTNHPEVMRITAKINQASSMQSHKMGATRMYTELHNAIGLQNEAQAAAASQGKPAPVVAVYQYPAFGFEYNANYGTYTFVGLFTIGPDKGDKPTFGFDLVKSNLISMEGTDHSQLLAKFAYPWNANVNFFYTEEGLAINMGNGTYETGLEVGNCHDLDTDKASGQDAVRAALVAEFKPAYELAWNNSTMIFPVKPSTYGQSSVSDTLAYINSHLSGETPSTNFRVTPYGDRFTYADMQFWIDGDSSYTLYFYDPVQGIYLAGISLSQQNGTPSGSTAEAKNEWFKTKRRERFMASAENWWDVQDSLYHMAFCIIIGATDNFAKNSYPYKMALQSAGGRWKWRQDDLDTIFDIDNSGRDTKPYQIEYTDAVDNSPYFAGSNSVFWNLLYECYWNDYTSTVTSLVTRGLQSLGRDVIRAMRSLSGKSNDYDGFVGYVKQCFWDRAQAYFPESAYNVDANFKYEQAWLVNGQSVPPLSQSLGNHYSGEELWVRRRAVYMMSLFKAGPFGDYSDRSLGTISFRPLGLAVSLYPAVWLYPAVEVGQNTVLTGGRTSPTGHADLSGAPDGNTEVYLQATNYLISLGDLKALRLGSQYLNNMTIEGRKLQVFTIGSATASQVTTNIPGLAFSNTYCLETIEARNASSIAGALDLSVCRRLRTIRLIGTSITALTIPTGSKVSTISLPATLQSIVFRSLKHLSISNVSSGGYANIRTFFVDGCDFDAFVMLADVVTQSSVLTYVRAVWSTRHVDTDNSALDIISTLTASRYKGLTADEGVLDKPFLEGEIRLDGSLHTADIEALNIVSESTYSSTLVKALSGLFNSNLYFFYNPSLVYISFVDAAVEAICASTWGDGTGLTKTQAQAVTSLALNFEYNTEIVSFDELRYFTSLTSIYTQSGGHGAFHGCTALVRVTLPDSVVTIGNYGFNGCSSLSSINLNNVTTIGINAFLGSGITTVNAPNLTTLYREAFNSCTKLTSVVSLGHITSIPDADSSGYGMFRNCANLEHIVFPTTLTYIGSQAFNGLSKLDCDINLPNLNSIGAQAFQGSGIRRILSLGNMTVIPGAGTSSGANGRGQFCYCARLTEVRLNNKITAVNWAGLRNCTALASIVGSGLITIQGYAFYECTALASFDFTSVTSIGTQAFFGAFANTVDIELNFQSLTSLGSVAFRGARMTKIVSLGSITSIPTDSGGTNGGCFGRCTRLTEVTIPATVTSIGQYAFGGCSALATVICLPTTPPTLVNSNAFTSNKSGRKIYVPYSADHSILDAYKAASNWSSYASYIYELDENGNIPT